MPPEHPLHTDDVDRAHYLAFARTWAAQARLSGLEPEKIEKRLVAYFRQLCLRLEPAVVLEIGAHEARFSRWAASELPGARVLAFEANPHVHEKFAGKLAGTRVEYLHAAVGPANGDVELHVPLEVAGRSRELTSRMASLEVHSRASDEVLVTVPGVRLDDHLQLAEGERVVAWIDVEGANRSVLEAAPAVLARTDAIHIEVEWETTWEGQWLDSDVALRLRHHGLVPVARDIKRHHQYNVVFVRSGLVDDLRTTRQAARVLRPRGSDD